jgi:CheY-like chemotaxis protein
MMPANPMVVVASEYAPNTSSVSKRTNANPAATLTNWAAARLVSSARKFVTKRQRVRGRGIAITPEIIILIVVAAIVLIAMPLGFYLILQRAPRVSRFVLLVSTDETARKLVMSAARKLGYGTVHVYRYEDGIARLQQNSDLKLIIIDDSVPQYEAGLMLSMLKGSPIGVRPLILIVDKGEVGQTAPSYRAEAVVARPLTDRALENAIRQVHQRLAELESL